MQDTLEKMQVEAFIWANKDDPDMYGEWDFEVELIRLQVSRASKTNHKCLLSLCYIYVA